MPRLRVETNDPGVAEVGVVEEMALRGVVGDSSDAWFCCCFCTSKTCSVIKSLFSSVTVMCFESSSQIPQGRDPLTLVARVNCGLYPRL